MTEQELTACRERLKTAVGELTLWTHRPNKGRHRMTKAEYIEPIAQTLRMLSELRR